MHSVTRREISLETVKPFVSVSEGETITEEIFALPADDRNIIYLHYYEGYSAAEIGRIIKKSENAVFIKLCRAREKLKDILEDNGNE